MDYFLENTHMGMLEKNKEYFSKLGGEKNENTENEETEMNIDTYKMFASFMKEKEGIIKIINEICQFVLNPEKNENQTIKSLDKLKEDKNRTIMLLSTYQEQPGLLDPILPNIIPQLTNTSLTLIDNYLKSEENLKKEKNEKDEKIKKDMFEYIKCIYELVYVICKIRGFAPIAKFFSSEVSIFENVIHFLISLPFDMQYDWYVNYVLILWTSILAMVPFDIDTIDSEGQLINKLISYFKEELTKSTNLRIITSYSLSKFLIRPDLIKKNYLDEYINFTLEKILNPNENNNIFRMLGWVLSLFEIFKNAQAKDLEKYIDKILKLLTYEFPKTIESSGIFRKNLTKLIQRVGLVFLKPRPQNWRYHQTLKTALSKNNEEIEEKNNQMEIEEDELDYEINSSALESILDFLLNHLSDKEYIVRWSAAKGVGRICERLTKSMVEDIFHSLFDLFSDDENEFAWHGACLCIAELCKRGMILPERLEELIPFLEKALIFETNKGTFCTGSNVRDAACYIVWALARSFTTDIMKGYIERLAGTLILTILFDKEVNCRRAASAAFQENVGRQGNFPHGIEILTEADYFTLGIRTNCYLNISIFIAQYDEYYKSIVEYLAFNRLIHIEKQIRELACETLALLVPFHPQIFVDEIIPKLMKMTVSPSLHIRHGSLIGIGTILLGINGLWDFHHKSRINRRQMLNGLSAKEKKILEDSDYRKEFDKFYEGIKYIDHINLIKDNSDLCKGIIGLIKKIDNAKLYRGKGSEIMRNGVNKFIRLISAVKLPIQAEDFIYYHDILIDNVRHSKNDIQEEACETLRKFNETYGNDFSKDENVKNRLEKIFLEMVNQSVTDDNIHVTKGYTSAIVNFNNEYILNHYELVKENLFKNSKKKKTNNNDPLTRKSAIESIGYITIKFMENKFEDIDIKIQNILDGFNDYEMDPKIGDVGSNIRIASVSNILEVMFALYKNKKYDVFKKYIIQSLNCVIKQLAEKMALVRKNAGISFQKFFWDLRDYIGLEEYIPQYEELKNIIIKDIEFDDDDNVYSIKWVEPEFAYPKIMPIIELNEYSDSFIEGLIRSIACISEDVHKASLDELKKAIEKKGDNKKELIEKIYQVVLNIFKNYAKDDKFIEPLESALSYLLSNQVFIHNNYIEYFNQIHNYVTKENYESKNIHKILNSIDIFYNLLFFEKEDKYKIIEKCLRSLLRLMCHKYPVVRKKASEKLFIFLSGIDEPENIGLDEEKLDNANIIIADTDWTLRVAEIKEKRNELAGYLNIKI